jgi:Cu/Ag efflux protein CusF
MKRIIGTLAAGALLAVTTAALAEEATGTIKTIEVPTRKVTLEDGKVYTALGRINLQQLKVGDKVKVTFDVATPLFQSLGIHGSATNIVVSN